MSATLRDMNKLGVTIVAAALLLLTGCSSTPAPAATTAATTPDAVATTEPTTTPEPLVAPTEPPAASATADDAQYLNEVRQRIQQLPDATDEQLIAAGHQSCELFGQGQAKFDQRLIEGETPDVNGIYPDSVAIATWAATVYCPEFS